MSTEKPKDLVERLIVYLRATRSHVDATLDSAYRWLAYEPTGLTEGINVLAGLREPLRLLTLVEQQIQDAHAPIWARQGKSPQEPEPAPVKPTGEVNRLDEYTEDFLGYVAELDLEEIVWLASRPFTLVDDFDGTKDNSGEMEKYVVASTTFTWDSYRRHLCILTDWWFLDDRRGLVFKHKEYRVLE